MSCWGYRVVKSENNSLDIRRVFDQSNDIIAIGEYPEKVKAESIDDLLVMLKEMIDCLSKPVIDYNTGEEI
jgi:hypothetical protein